MAAESDAEKRTLRTHTGTAVLGPTGTLEELRSDEDIYATSQATPLVSILYTDGESMWKANEWTELFPNDVVFPEDRSPLTIVFSEFDGRDITVELQITIDRGEFHFVPEITNNSDGVVVGATVPRIAGFDTTDEPSLYVPNRAGERLDQPFATFDAERQTLPYPVPLSAQFLTCTDGDAGWAVYAFDETCTYKEFSLGGDAALVSVSYFCFLEPGESGRIPTTVLKLYSGTWHSAADRYREWFDSWARPPARSDLLEQLPYVYEWFLIDQHDASEAGTETLKKYGDYGDKISEIADRGYDAVWLVSWHDRGLDTDFPEFDVTEVIGYDELADMTDVMKNHGLQVGFYFNARLANAESDVYTANNHWAVDPRRTVDISEQYFEEHHVLCPGAPGRIDHLVERIEFVVTELGADFVFLDQIGAAPAHLCFDERHDHETPATAWIEGYEELLARVHEVGRRHNSGFWVFIEGAWDAIGQFVDMQMGGVWSIHPDGDPCHEIYRYTFPDHYMGDENMNASERDPVFLGGVPMRRGDPATSRTTLYRNTLAESDFMDDVGLTYDADDVSAKWHRADDAAIIVVQNRTPDGITTEIALDSSELPQSRIQTLETLRETTVSDIAFDEHGLRCRLDLGPEEVNGVYIDFS
ncbi:MAG: DUF6259 domain-containing protein [Halobacteriales archaeon]